MKHHRSPIRRQFAASRGGFMRTGDRFAARGGGFAESGDHTFSMLYLETGADLTAATGLAADGLYPLLETSGNVTDAIAGAVLALTGSPNFNSNVSSRKGIHYNAGSQWHRGDYSAIGVGSAIYSVAGRINRTASSMGLLGRWVSGGSTGGLGLSLFIPASGNVGANARDAAANSVLSIPSVNVFNYPGGFLFSAQVDRAANLLRTRISFGRGITAVAGPAANIAGVGTLTIAGQSLGLAAYPGANSSGQVLAWAMTALGAQCEGASKLIDLHRALGAES